MAAPGQPAEVRGSAPPVRRRSAGENAGVSAGARSTNCLVSSNGSAPRSHQAPARSWFAHRALRRSVHVSVLTDIGFAHRAPVSTVPSSYQDSMPEAARRTHCARGAHVRLREQRQATPATKRIAGPARPPRSRSRMSKRTPKLGHARHARPFDLTSRNRRSCGLIEGHRLIRHCRVDAEVQV